MIYRCRRLGVHHFCLGLLCAFLHKTLEGLGKSKRGLTNRGLSLKISEKGGGTSALENRPFSGLTGAFPESSGLSGPIGTHPLCTSQPRRKSRIGPKGPVLAQLLPFGQSPRLLGPRLDFPKRALPDPNAVSLASLQCTLA